MNSYERRIATSSSTMRTTDAALRTASSTVCCVEGPPDWGEVSVFVMSVSFLSDLGEHHPGFHETVRRTAQHEGSSLTLHDLG